MGKRNTAARQPLDAESALAFIRQRFGRHRHGLEEIVRHLLSVASLEPDFSLEMQIRGLTDWAGDHLLREPRDAILHSVRVFQHEADATEAYPVTVRSVLRDWPIGVCKGLPLERCTPDDLEREIHHSQRTAEEILRRVRVLRAVVEQARDKGCEVIGDLPDEILDACLEQGRL